MDMSIIYNASVIGNNILKANYTESLSGLYILASIKYPCYELGDETKNAILNYTGCAGSYNISFEGVQKVDEDLINGKVYYPFTGTYDVDLYYQISVTNLNTEDADYLDTINLQVNYG